MVPALLWPRCGSLRVAESLDPSLGSDLSPAFRCYGFTAISSGYWIQRTFPFQMSEFKIPRLASIAARVKGRAKGRASSRSMLSRPLCHLERGLNSYCSRSAMSAARRDRRDRSSDSYSGSSSDDEGRSNTSGSDSDNNVSGEERNENEDKGGDGDPLQQFFSVQKRVDAKVTTLTLLPSTVKHYFSTVLKDGELSKEGREELADKYYLDPAQWEKFHPPRLDDTKLFRLAKEEFNFSRAGRLVSIHLK